MYFYFFHILHIFFDLQFNLVLKIRLFLQTLNYEIPSEKLVLLYIKCGTVHKNPLIISYDIIFFLNFGHKKIQLFISRVRKTN